MVEVCTIFVIASRGWMPRDNRCMYCSNVHGKELSHMILVPENHHFFLTYKQRKPLIMRRIKQIYNRNK